MTVEPELYKFTRNNEEWLFTSSDSDIEYDGNIYKAITITRTEFRQRKELTKASINVKFSLDDEFARQFFTNYNDYQLSLTIFEKGSVDTIVVWIGRLASIQPAEKEIIFKMESIYTSARRAGNTARVQKNCRHALYGKGCNLNKEDFAIHVQISSIDSTATIITIPDASSYADGWFTGGMIEDNIGTLRFVINHVGDQITLQWAWPQLKDEFENAEYGYGLNYGNYYGGLSIKLYPGCDLLRSTCKNKFDNILNHGAFPWLPSKNPMGSEAII